MSATCAPHSTRRPGGLPRSVTDGLTFRSATPAILRDPHTQQPMLLLGWWCKDDRRLFADVWVRGAARTHAQIAAALDRAITLPETAP